MAVVVATNSFDADSYPEATGWHVDEDSHLHVLKKGSGNIGVYPAGEWLSARDYEPVVAGPA